MLVKSQFDGPRRINILANSEKIYIPMPGAGFCLNTSQTANIMMYEAVRQIERCHMQQAERFATAVFHD